MLQHSFCEDARITGPLLLQAPGACAYLGGLACTLRLVPPVQIVENDHLRHRGLYRAVAADMAERWTSNGVSLLDLGCGGAE